MVEPEPIVPRGPFSLAAAQDFAGGFPAGIGGGRATATSLVLAFPVEPYRELDAPAAGGVSGPSWRHSAIVELSQVADDRPVRARVATDGDPAAALRQALRSVSLDHDGIGWPAVGERDAVIGQLQREHRFLRPVCFYSAYEAATSFVIGQRIARTQAARIKTGLSLSLGDRLELGGQTFHAFPRPERLLEAREFAGLSAEKVVRLHGVAEAALDGRLDTERLRALPPAEALEALRTLRGIGGFTAQGVLLRGCGLADVLPDDALSDEVLGEMYGASGDPAAAGAISDRWRPYRMWATVLLRVGWGRRQIGPVSYRLDRPAGSASRRGGRPTG